MGIARYLSKLGSVLSAEGVVPSSKGGTGITSPGASGNILVSNGTAWLSASSANRVVALTDSTTVTINADTTDIATQANTQATGTLTIAAPTGTPTNGQKIIFRLRSTNVQTFSWNAIFTGSTDLALPTASTGTNKYDYVGFIYNSTAAKWQLLAKNFGH
jgi:hypothetical protein